MQRVWLEGVGGVCREGMKIALAIFGVWRKCVGLRGKDFGLAGIWALCVGVFLWIVPRRL